MDIKSREFWIFLDDSGNIELSDDSTHFSYAALLFCNIEDVENFRIDYKNTLISLFGTSEEVKGSDRISKEKRKRIHDCIIRNNCKLFSITEKKVDSTRLVEIDYTFNSLCNLLAKNKKQKRAYKKIRKKEYGRHKTYLIGQLIALIKQTSVYFSDAKINIISDKEYLWFPEFNSMNEYLTAGQKYLRWFKCEFNFSMQDSKKDYCLQGADFLAYSVYRHYNHKDSEFFINLNDSKEIVSKEFPFIKQPQIS